MKPRKKKNELYRKIIKSMIKARQRQERCPSKCVKALENLVTHNVCIACPCYPKSPYHQDYLKNKTFKQIKKEIKFVFDFL